MNQTKALMKSIYNIHSSLQVERQWTTSTRRPKATVSNLNSYRIPLLRPQMMVNNNQLLHLNIEGKNGSMH